MLDPIKQAIPRIGVPVLVIRGDRDHLSSLDWAGHLAGLAPDGRLAGPGARPPGVGPW